MVKKLAIKIPNYSDWLIFFTSSDFQYTTKARTKSLKLVNKLFTRSPSEKWWLPSYKLESKTSEFCVEKSQCRFFTLKEKKKQNFWPSNRTERLKPRWFVLSLCWKLIFQKLAKLQSPYTSLQLQQSLCPQEKQVFFMIGWKRLTARDQRKLTYLSPKSLLCAWMTQDSDFIRFP